LKKKFFGKKIFWSQMTNRSFPLRRQMQRFTSFMTRKRFGRNHWNVFQFYDKKKKSHFRTDGIEWTILLLSTKKSLKKKIVWWSSVSYNNVNSSWLDCTRLSHYIHLRHFSWVAFLPKRI
jgi:hypothetical protein